jgi:hypothetical protein
MSQGMLLKLPLGMFKLPGKVLMHLLSGRKADVVRFRPRRPVWRSNSPHGAKNAVIFFIAFPYLGHFLNSFLLGRVIDYILHTGKDFPIHKTKS